MGRKRLQHAADILCHMFRGWQLNADFEQLTAWAQGVLLIDALAGTCLHDGRPVRLAMAGILREWLLDDLEQNGIGGGEVVEAVLEVTFSTEQYEGQRVPSVSYGRPTRRFVGCHVICRSRIKGHGRTYQAELEDTLEWPLPAGVAGGRQA